MWEKPVLALIWPLLLIPVQLIQNFQNSQEKAHNIHVDADACNNVVLLAVLVLKKKEI
jgi:hypothetical protein